MGQTSNVSAKVSIITPLYNRAKLVLDTVDSVRGQSFENWELLIVDDHSTDHSLRAVTDYSRPDERIKVWSRKSTCKGAPACRNEGLATAVGEFVLFLDSDDLLAKTCLENRLSKFDARPHFDAHIFPSEMFRKSPGDLGRKWCVPSQDPLTDFLEQPLWQTTAALWKSDSVKRIGGFREDLMAWQDWDLFVRCIVEEFEFCVHNDSEADNYVRRSLHQRISQTAERNRDSIKNRRVLFRDIYTLLRERKKLNPQRIEAMRKLFVNLAVKMHLTKMHAEADQWIAELPSFGLIGEREVESEQKKARQLSRLNLRQQMNELKLKFLQWIRK